MGLSHFHFPYLNFFFSFLFYDNKENEVEEKLKPGKYPYVQKNFKHRRLCVCSCKKGIWYFKPSSSHLNEDIFLSYYLQTPVSSKTF